MLVNQTHSLNIFNLKLYQIVSDIRSSIFNWSGTGSLGNNV